MPCNHIKRVIGQIVKGKSEWQLTPCFKIEGMCTYKWWQDSNGKLQRGPKLKPKPKLKVEEEGQGQNRRDDIRQTNNLIDIFGSAFDDVPYHSVKYDSIDRTWNVMLNRKPHWKNTLKAKSLAFYAEIKQNRPQKAINLRAKPIQAPHGWKSSIMWIWWYFIHENNWC